jgi:hypothetical protein
MLSQHWPEEDSIAQFSLTGNSQIFIQINGLRDFRGVTTLLTDIYQEEQEYQFGNCRRLENLQTK